MKKIALILIAAAACFSSCTKNSLPQPDTKRADKTGITSSNKPIITIPRNIYVAGYYHSPNGHTVAAYWVNNVMTRLATDSSVNSQARALVVSGSNVYVVGFINNSSSVPHAVCWKNGVQLSLDAGTNSDAKGIMLIGTDIYVAGYHNYFRSTTPHAVYWKNGVATYLDVTTANSEATAIAANGTDIYVSGDVGPWLSYFSRATIWKNGVAATLGDTTSQTIPTGLCISNNVIYMAGYYSTSTYGPAYGVTWTNGIMSYLPIYPGATCYTNHILIINGAKYVLGNETTGSPSFTLRSWYWNGSTKTLIPATHIADEDNSGGLFYYSGVLYYASNRSSDGIIWVNQQAYQTISHKGIINDLLVN